MEGTWGRRVYGTVTKTPRTTRFRLEVTMDNGCTIFETKILSNEELDRFPRAYGLTLDYLTAKLDARLAQRFQEWMRK